MEKVMSMTYASSLTDLCEVNSSFDKGVLRVAYHGLNRNGSSISKDAFERSIQTMFGCPVVCNYDRDTDTLGGHDVEVVRDSEGGLRLVNSTQPVGCIPESARYWWDTVTEEDGTEHEYLYVEALLWKRQEAYRKIKKDGVTAHSMEITVKDGELVDGVYYIYDFEFTAFALIGVTPCFESSALQVFSEQDFKEKYFEMMRDLKESFQTVNPSQEDDNTHPENYSMEGGRELQDKHELAAQYGIDIESLDFSLDDYTIEELTQKFEEMKAAAQDPQVDETGDGSNEDQFALNSNVTNELVRALEAVTLEREWGECSRYWYVDCDLEAQEVYCWDCSDWLLYGFTYAMNGDNAVIDFESKKRMKYAIVAFDEGEQPSPFATVFEQMEQKIKDASGWEAKYNEASETIESMNTELGELRQFKSDAESVAANAAREAVFSRFADLAGVEAFEQLRENCSEYDTETLEEKCYAIRGRQAPQAKFSLDETQPKLKVERHEISNEPYGGIFAQYGIEAN